MDLGNLISETLYMLRRRAWLILFVAIFGILGATFFAYILLPKYEASARILVESQQIPDALARSTVNSSAAERLALIEQRLMSRDNIVDVIGRLGLYADRPDLTLQEKVDALRSATRIERIALTGPAARAGAGISAFSIKVILNSPQQAAAVANEFVALILQQNLKARSDRARETLAFFGEEANRLATVLTEVEAQITLFKTENAADLPESLEFRRTELARLNDGAFEIDRRILQIEEQKGLLLSGAALNQPGQRETPEATQLRILNGELLQKRSSLAENHPDVRRLVRLIAALEQEIAGRSAAVGLETSDAADALQAARLAAVRPQVDLLDGQIALLRDQKAQMAARKAAIEASILRTPNVETQLNVLLRRQVELREQYAAIVRKRSEAEIGDRLESSQQSERFEVIDNAIPPEEPISPNRRRIAVLGAGLALAGALGLAFLLEMLNPVIRSSAQLERQLQVAPVVSIPHVRTSVERWRRRGVVLCAALAILVGVPVGLWFVDRHVRPLEFLVARVAEKSGADELVRAIRTRF